MKVEIEISDELIAYQLIDAGIYYWAFTIDLAVQKPAEPFKPKNPLSAIPRSLYAMKADGWIEIGRAPGKGPPHTQAGQRSTQARALTHGREVS